MNRLTVITATSGLALIVATMSTSCFMSKGEDSISESDYDDCREDLQYVERPNGSFYDACMENCADSYLECIQEDCSELEYGRTVDGVYCDWGEWTESMGELCWPCNTEYIQQCFCDCGDTFYCY